MIAVRNNLAQIIDRQPQVLIAFAGMLTVVWLALLIWLPLRLLHLV